MLWFHIKWWLRGWYFFIKKHIFCRFFHRRRRCYPEVWGRGLDGPWHCMICVSCNAALDYWFEWFELDKRRKK